MYGLEALIPLLILGIIVVILILPIVALVKAYGVGREVESLRGEVAKLRARLSEPPGDAPHAQPARQPQTPPETPTLPEVLIARQRPVTIQHETVVPPPPVVPPAPTMPPPPPVPQAPMTPAPERAEPRMEQSWQAAEATRPAAPPAKSRSLSEWEMLIGGNVVNWLAAAAMVIVTAYFLKYAYDQRWITPPILVCIGFATGLALLFGGSRFHRQGARVFAQGLLGAGISILYLSGYATLRYEMVNQPVAFGIMALVTAVAIVQALRYDSLVVCLLGLAGGFVTPALFGGNGNTGGGTNHFGLFAYIALLDLGLLAVAMKKDSWAAIIEPLALLGTYVVYLGWADANYTRSLFWTAIPFLTAVWLLFCCADTSRIVRSVSTYNGLRSAVGVCNSLLFYATVYFLIQHKCGTNHEMFRQWIVLATISIGAVYFINLLALIRSRAEDRSFIGRYVLTAIATLVIATSIQFEGFMRVSLLAVEALALVWCGIKWQTRTAIWSGLALSAVAAVMLLVQPESFAFIIYKIHRTAFWNPRCMAYVTVAAVSGLIAWLFARSEIDERATLRALYQSACYALLGVSLAVETNEFFRLMVSQHLTKGDILDYPRYVAMGGVWAAYALVLSAIGVLRRSDLTKGFGLVFLALGAALIAGKAIDTANTGAFMPVLNVRALGFAVIFASILIARCVLSKRSEAGDWTEALPGVFRIAISLLAFELVTVETWQLFDCHSMAHAIASLGVQRGLLTYLSLGTAWVLYSLPMLWFGLRQRYQALAVIGLCALAAGVLTIACHGFHYQPVESFRPIANARFAAFAVAVIGMLTSYRMLARRQDAFGWVHGMLGVLQVTISLFIFELVTAETRDLFTNKPTLSSTNMRAMMLSVAWLVYSFLLISFGFWRRAQTIRLVAISLFGITILKVFFSDLSFLRQPYRMFSFGGLALILFATSYLYQRFRGVILGAEESEAA